MSVSMVEARIDLEFPVLGPSNELDRVIVSFWAWIRVADWKLDGLCRSLACVEAERVWPLLTVSDLEARFPSDDHLRGHFGSKV